MSRVDLNPNAVVVPIAATSADGTAAVNGPTFSAPVRIIAAYVSLSSAVGAHSANYATISVINKGTTGSGTTSVGAAVTTTAIAQDKPTALTLSSTKSAREISAACTLNVTIAKAAAGVATKAGAVTILYAHGTGGSI